MSLGNILPLDRSTPRSLRGDCEEFRFRIFAEKLKQRFCEAAEVFRALLRGHLRPFNQKWWCIQKGFEIILVIFSKISVQKALFTSLEPTKSHVTVFYENTHFLYLKILEMHFLDLQKNSASSRRPVFANPRLRRDLNLRKINQSS